MHAPARRSSTLVLACCAAVAMLAGCKADPGPKSPDVKRPDSCMIDTDCSSDGSKICVGGICIENHPDSCLNGEACPDGKHCNELSGVCEANTTPDGGQPGDGGGNPPCNARCDCPFGSTCQSGQCVAVAVNTGCAQDAQCGRGQTCNFSHVCEAGCADSCDCEAPKTCSLTRFQCEPCSASNQCPDGQVCKAGGTANAECVSSVSCGSSADCNSSVPGTICVSGSCVNCSLDNQCHSAPYGGGYICSGGNCATGCDTTACQSTCTQQGLSCNTTSCQCDQVECSDQNCGGAPCNGTDVCDSSCTCIPVGTSTDCTTNGCTNGQTCVSSAPAGASPFPGCGDGTSACATDCSFNQCPNGWDCVDLNQSLCTSFGLTAGSFCAKECGSAADCPGGQDCCATSEGFNVCSALGACISM